MTEEQQIALADEMARFYDDPLGFVMFVFPWGEDSSQGSMAQTSGQLICSMTWPMM